MREIQQFIDYEVLVMHMDPKRKHLADAISEQSFDRERGSHYDDDEDIRAIKRILKRFKLINPQLIYGTIKKLEAQGLVSV